VNHRLAKASRTDPTRTRTLFRQAVLVLRWFRERGCVHCPARDAGISQATGYRYLHEGIDILADQAPDMHKVVDRCRHVAMTHVILDGTLIESDRLAGVRGNDNDLWFSHKHKAFGGNVQVLAAPDGTPLWVSDVEPGSTPDITAARIHALPALYRATANSLPTLADKGYIGAGIGILVPARRPKGRSGQALHADTRTTNKLIRGVHALEERAVQSPTPVIATLLSFEPSAHVMKMDVIPRILEETLRLWAPIPQITFRGVQIPREFWQVIAFTE
jgi:hypothetical protein